MNIIALKGMQFHSFHGYYAEEQSVGNNYEIDIIAEKSWPTGSMEDQLENTLNYEDIYSICQDEMSKPRRLIESVADSILDRLKNQLDDAARYTVVIRKKHPLLGGLVDHAMVEVRG